MCSHNPRPAYITESLESLRSQTLPVSEWDLTLIDNASATPLKETVVCGWHPRRRIIREEALGLTHARLRGIRETTGSILVFVDDDNILNPDYLQRVIEIAYANPHIGAWGGGAKPRFEKDPPLWTRRFWGNLVIRDIEQDSWSNLYHTHSTVPLGAGLCVRREAAQYYVKLHDDGQRGMMLDRAGTQLLSGGDTDLALCALDIGLGCGNFKALSLVHIIPANRLEERYLINLAAGIAYSAVVLRSFRPSVCPPEMERRIVGRIADGLRMIRANPLERRLKRALGTAEEDARKDLAHFTARSL
ncbi:MAG TPA: glycosyltransferase [Gemmatimonadaceae bacterium]|nr:glycosyltransferase [Gemmatimonadaceae bacterium]